MLPMTDSFTEYLALLVGAMVPVKWVHVTADDESNLFSLNALNMGVLGTFQTGSTEEALISLDLIGDDERLVYLWAELIIDALRERQYTPELNYTPNPATPTATGRMVMWWAANIRFQAIESGSKYLHLNATFPITHAR